MQGSARKDVVFGAARVYTAAVLGTKWKSWLKPNRAPLRHELSALFQEVIVGGYLPVEQRLRQAVGRVSSCVGRPHL